MKSKIFLFLAAPIFIATLFFACKEQEGEKEKNIITLITSSTRNANFNLAGNDEITIDWNDGTKLDTLALSSDTIINIRHNYLPDRNYKITITGNVTQLSCNYNNITSLEVNTSPSLIKLNCGNNSITTLDVSKCTALTTLDCSDNRFSVAALNDLFETLNNLSASKTIEIYSNSGCENCDRSIAQNKGWQVGECW